MIISKLKQESGFIIKNGWSVFLKLFSVALSFLAFRWINANLEPQVLEQVNVSLAVNGFVIGFIAFGVPTLAQKVFTNHYEDQGYLATAWTSLLFIRVISFFVGLLIIWLVSLSGLLGFDILFAIYISQFLFLADTIFRAIVDSDNRSWQYSFSDLIAKTVLIVVLFQVSMKLPFFNDWSDLHLYILALTVSALTAISVDTWMQRKSIKLSKISWNFLKENRKTILFLSLSSIIVGSYLTTDKVFLKVFNFDEFAINGYSNAYKLYETASIIPGITMPVLASSIRKRILSIQDESQKRSVILRYARLTIIAGLVVTTAIAVFGPFALSLIDPKRLYYDISLQTLWILAGAVTLTFPALFFAFQNIFNGNEKLELKIQFANMVAALILYTILISQFSYIGAAISTLLVNVNDLLIRFVLLKKNKMLKF